MNVFINAYADDEQICASYKDPVKLEMKLQCQLPEADQWFGMRMERLQILVNIMQWF